CPSTSIAAFDDVFKTLNSIYFNSVENDDNGFVPTKIEHPTRAGSAPEAASEISADTYATHGTSMSRDNKLIGADNKGVAAILFEDWYASTDATTDVDIVKLTDKLGTAKATDGIICEKLTTGTPVISIGTLAMGMTSSTWGVDARYPDETLSTKMIGERGAGDGAEDPLLDFKRSMDEMVEFQGIDCKDWDQLEELLQWYLNVNDKKNHKFIVSSFLDFLLGISYTDGGCGGGPAGVVRGCDSFASTASFSSAVTCFHSRVKYASNIDKEMALLKFVDAATRSSVGAFSWYATHETSMSRHNKLIGGDKKGVAAMLFEDWYASTDKATYVDIVKFTDKVGTVKATDGIICQKLTSKEFRLRK
ncbi:Transcription repressor OFP13, partial [Linum perenne]